MNCFVWQTYSGIKGLSPLHILPTFDIISGIAIDYMHCLLEGIGKCLFAIWLTPSAHPYSIGKHIELLDKCLLSIKPPDTISRVPQAISKRKKWKGVVMALLCMHVYFYITSHVYQTHTASEFRSWMLYYCIPVLEGLLPPPYYDHLALLVCSMHILLGDNITSEGLTN